MVSEKISTKVIQNDLLGVVVEYVVIQFLQKKSCVGTENCCVLLAFIFPDLVCCWWHIIKTDIPCLFFV